MAQYTLTVTIQSTLLDGVFAANDLTALSALSVLGQHAIHVPDHVAVIGLNVEEAERSVPALLLVADA